MFILQSFLHEKPRTVPYVILLVMPAAATRFNQRSRPPRHPKIVALITGGHQSRADGREHVTIAPPYVVYL